MEILIHRGAKQVGGTCIEISSNAYRILLDFGLPLSFDFGDDIKSFLPQPLFDDLTHGTKKVDAVFLSHAHLDHYGLAGFLPSKIPIYLSNATKKIMGFSDEFTPNKIGTINTAEFQSYSPVKIGEITVTPFLMDHSAFDAHGFLVEAGGKSIFYTGDFRGHGLNKALTSELAAKLPPIDVLLMEGTIIGERESEFFQTEEEIETKFMEICREFSGPVLVSVPSQNIDRIISLYRTAMRSNRNLIIDLYSAELFNRLKEYTNSLPQAGGINVSIWYPFFQRENLVQEKLFWVMKKYRPHKQPLPELAKESKNPVILLRPPFRKEIGRHFDLSEAVWVYSMWTGYLERSVALQRLKAWAIENCIPFKLLHTSGHAKLDDLKKFVSSLSPKRLIPVHSFHPEQYSQHFEHVSIFKDNERIFV
ncbi:MBL fold metallo-hydrolase [Desulfocastanea catecholica]